METTEMNHQQSVTKQASAASAPPLGHDLTCQPSGNRSMSGKHDLANTIDPPVLLTYKQAARVLQVSDRTVWSLVNGGKLPMVRLGRSVRIDPRDLDAYIQRSKSTQEREQ